MKNAAIYIVGALVAVAGIAACTALLSDQGGVIQHEPIAPQDPSITEMPTASSIVVGEPITESILNGGFSVPGVLRLIDDGQMPSAPGAINIGWEFTPNDMTRYNVITGTVTVAVFEYKLTFAENGGFEINDIYFNSSYTLSERLITAKNDYHFDDWGTTNNIADRISYPFTVSSTTTLCAQYTFHTAEKIRYGTIRNSNGPDEAYASAVWGSNGIPEKPLGLNPFDPPISGSISGEVVIADLHNGLRVTDVASFDHTNITGIVFPNYIEEIGKFQQCRSLGPELTIPKGVVKIGNNAFDNCWSLEKVEFENGEGFIELGDFLFYQSGLKEITLHRMTYVPWWAFGFCYIQTVSIPAEVTIIGQNAFTGCASLREIILEGNKITKIDNLAFDSCAITTLSLPPGAIIAPDAFRYCTDLEDLVITDEQIIQIAKGLHESYIGPADNFTVRIERNSIYGGLNFEGEYQANTETIDLKFEKVSIYVLNALIHEFFHHYQYVLMYGVGSEDFYSVPVYVSNYSRYGIIFENPYMIVANDRILYTEANPSMGYLYEHTVQSCMSAGGAYVLVDNDRLDRWKQPYIDLLPDNSNWSDYWNQPLEKDVRFFAAWFTGDLYGG